MDQCPRNTIHILSIYRMVVKNFITFKRNKEESCGIQKRRRYIYRYAERPKIPSTPLPPALFSIGSLSISRTDWEKGNTSGKKRQSCRMLSGGSLIKQQI